MGVKGTRGVPVRGIAICVALFAFFAFAPSAMAAITFTQTPSNPSNDPTPTFDYNDPAFPAATFQCRLGTSGAFNPCGPPVTLGGVPEKQGNVFQVRRTGVAGSLVSFTWDTDYTPPNPIVATPANGDRFTLHENVPPSVACTDPNGGSPAWNSGCASNTSPAVDTELPLGPRLYTANATDNAGNTGTTTTAYTVDPPRYDSLVTGNDPLAYYRLAEAIGSSEMLDSSGNDHHGEYKDTNPAVSLGRQGAISCGRRPHPPRICETSSDPENKAAYFPGRDGYGYVNGITAPTSAYTMEAWVKPRVSGAMMILGHGGGGQLYRQSNNRLALRQTQDVVADTNAGGFKVLTTGAWSHVAATWNGTTTRLYVNGDLVQTSTTANKPPSGTSTFYVGYGEMAPWFRGDIDEAAYYGTALSEHDFDHRYATGTAKDLPSLQAGNHPHNTEGPFTDPGAPKNGGLYAPAKVPNANFTCTDPDDLPGNPDVASCTAAVSSNGGPFNPVANLAPLPNALGTHIFRVTAVDDNGNTYVHDHTYIVRAFMDIYLNAADGPVAYYRLGEPLGATTMNDASPNDHDGEYKNGQSGGHPGISGDGNFAHEFAGTGGYGYANGIQAPRHQMTLEAWVRPDSQTRTQSIVGHGDAGEIYMQNRRFKIRHMDKTVTAQQTADPGSALPTTGTWSHVVGTWDGVDLRIWVNGYQRGSIEDSARATSASTFYVGYGQLAPWFDGRIDEVAYYSTALNANRVFQHFLAAP